MVNCLYSDKIKAFILYVVNLIWVSRSLSKLFTCLRRSHGGRFGILVQFKAQIVPHNTALQIACRMDTPEARAYLAHYVTLP